jgi:transcriptional regulator with XRE-family HTH domain
MSVEHNEVSAEEAFGAEVRLARESLDWTQESLARHLRDAGIRIDQAAVARLEQGKRAIRFNEAAELARLLGLDLRPYGATIMPLDEAGYRDAVQELQKIKDFEDQAAKNLEGARQVVSLRERDVAAWREQRLRLEAAIREYEGRSNGER